MEFSFTASEKSYGVKKFENRVSKNLLLLLLYKIGKDNGFTQKLEDVSYLTGVAYLNPKTQDIIQVKKFSKKA